MPLDDTSRTTEPEIAPIDNTLASLGLTPVSREVVERHKRHMTREYALKGRSEAYRVASGLARWKTISFEMIPSNDLAKAIHTGLSRVWTEDHSRVPDAIVKVARRVDRGIENAEFSVQYFDVDPILDVCYTDRSGHRHLDCLGIWDQGKIIAIASDNGLAAETANKTSARRFVLAGITFVVMFAAMVGLAALAGEQPHPRRALNHQIIWTTGVFGNTGVNHAL